MTRGRAGVLITTACLAAATAPAGGQRAGDVPAILISRQLLENRGLRIGDLVRLAPEPSGERARIFRIDGTYEPTPDPMRFAQPRLEARMHLPDLLSLTGDPSDPAAIDAVTSINVALKDPADADRFGLDVAARLPALVARPTGGYDERATTFIVLERFHLAIGIVTILGSTVFLLALMVMLVDERRGTVGTLRLIGLTRRRILAQVMAEGAMIASAGALFGLLFALAAQDAFNRFFQWRYDTTLIFLRITPRVLWQSLLIALPLGVTASLLASWTLLRRKLLALVGR